MSTVDDAIEAGARELLRQTVTAHPERASKFEWERARRIVRRAQVKQWPILSAPLREQHQPVHYYDYDMVDACPDTSDEHREKHHYEDADDYGEFYCDQLPVGGPVCAECRDNNGDRVEYPCPTMITIIETDKELG